MILLQKKSPFQKIGRGTLFTVTLRPRLKLMATCNRILLQTTVGKQATLRFGLSARISATTTPNIFYGIVIYFFAVSNPSFSRTTTGKIIGIITHFIYSSLTRLGSLVGNQFFLFHDVLVMMFSLC